MYAYPWAIHDLGLDRSLDEMRSYGIDAVQLALSYHAASYISPRNPRRRVYAGDLGALQFEPSDHVDMRWPFAPPVADHARDAEHIPSLLHACDVRGMDVIAWVVYLYNHSIARAHPTLTVRNVFGDLNGAQLCPSNPLVRDFALALTRSVLLLGRFAGFHAESLSYLPFDYGLWNLKSAIVPDAEARHLLSLCFCQHCVAAAGTLGIDVDLVSSTVRGRLDTVLNGLADGGGRALGSGPFGGSSESALDAFCAFRAARVVSLHREVFGIAGEAGCFVSTNSVEQEQVLANGSAPQKLRPLVDAVRIRIRSGCSSATIRDDIAEATAGAPARAPVYADYQMAVFATEKQFHASVEAAVDAGLVHHRFYEFSQLSERHTAWLRHGQRLWGSGT